MDSLIDRFYDSFQYGILYIAWDGLRIDMFKTKEEMNKAYNENKGGYKYIRRVRIENIN